MRYMVMHYQTQDMEDGVMPSPEQQAAIGQYFPISFGRVDVCFPRHSVTFGRVSFSTFAVLFASFAVKQLTCGI